MKTITTVFAIVKRGQLELLTGAYYEAVLAIVPEPGVKFQLHDAG